jgi:serine/threonine-protein kinase RsbT
MAAAAVLQDERVSHTVDTFQVRYVSDAVWAASRVRALGLRFGMRWRARHELSVVVSELVTNAVKFAGSGTVTVRQLTSPKAGLEVEVEDHGPGVADPELAVLDGYSEGAMVPADKDPRGRRGLGSGLSAVKRLSDELQIVSPSEGRTRVVARKYLPVER